MIRDLAALARDMAEVRRAMAQSMRPGRVAEVDPAAGTVRLDLGDGMLSAAVPYQQIAGALKVHAPPVTGQQMILMAPAGETAQGVAVPLSWGGGNDSPSSAGDENVLTFGDVAVSLDAAGLTILVGGVTVRIDASGLHVFGGTVEHDGANIGSTHRHGGVDRGSSQTDHPQ